MGYDETSKTFDLREIAEEAWPDGAPFFGVDLDGFWYEPVDGYVAHCTRTDTLHIAEAAVAWWLLKLSEARRKWRENGTGARGQPADISEATWKLVKWQAMYGEAISRLADDTRQAVSKTGPNQAVSGGSFPGGRGAR